MRVGIDPGHGGSDRGASAFDLIEGEWVMTLAELLWRRFTAEKHEPTLTRERDKDPWFVTRGMRTRGLDAVVSLHVNAAERTTRRGCELYHWPGSSHGLALAQTIAEYMPPELRDGGKFPRIFAATDDPATDSDDWLQRPRTVLRWHNPPAVLIEVGYCTNYDERRFMLSDQGIEAIADAITAGVLGWWSIR